MKTSLTTPLFCAILLLSGAGCTRSETALIHTPTSTAPTQQTPTSTSLLTYTNEKLGFSVDTPSTTIVTDCSRHTENGTPYVMPDLHTPAPLRPVEVPNGVIFYPEWYMETFGTVLQNYSADCRKVIISGASLTQREIYRDFPYWTILSDTLKSEKEIARSVSTRCRRRFASPALYTGLTSTTQAGVFQVGIELDMKKTDDSSAVFCPDLVYARYVPVTKRIYYLFQNGPYRVDDPAPQLIQDSLRFSTTTQTGSR